MFSPGFLARWPLRAPNVNLNIPHTISDMVNILTDPEATSAFSHAQEEAPEGEGLVREEGMPSHVYDYDSSKVMKDQVTQARKATSHAKAPGILGHVVLPGHISFYKRDGKTFAVTEGRWLLTSPKARWIVKNVSLDKEIIHHERSQVLILRVEPGCVGRILDQGVPILLDVGTHVFNSGTVSNVGSKKIADCDSLNHGKFH